MQTIIDSVGMKLSMDDTKWKLNDVLFADDSVFLAENKMDLQKLLNELNTNYKKRKLSWCGQK